MRAPISDTYLNRIIKGKGRVVITASRGNEVSMEKDSLEHGVFTYYILEALEQGDKNNDGLISHEELFNYVSEKVPQETGRNQHPVKYEEDVEEPIVIGKKRGE